jgi:hypothetical protein
MNELNANPKIVDVTIRKRKEHNKWVISIHGVTSGFIVHTTEEDSTIEFRFDANRFNPHISIH